MKILITGCASNIAFNVALNLIKKGHFVYLTVHHDYEIKTVLRKLKNYQYNNCSCFKLDITNEEDRLKIRNYDIDCLINNAGIGMGGSILDIDILRMKENFEVNVFGTIRLTQIYAAHLLVNKKQGKIIFISSIAGIIPISFLGSYCATKASLISLATALKRELKLITNNIKIKLIEPGIYNTGFNDVMLENKLITKSKYFKNLENITLKQKKLFKIIGKNSYTTIVNKITEATLDNSSKFLYRAPIIEGIIVKLYMLLFK